MIHPLLSSPKFWSQVVFGKGTMSESWGTYTKTNTMYQGQAFEASSAWRCYMPSICLGYVLVLGMPTLCGDGNSVAWGSWRLCKLTSNSFYHGWRSSTQNNSPTCWRPMHSMYHDPRELTATYRWIGRVWEMTGWSSRLQENNRWFQRNPRNILNSRKKNRKIIKWFNCLDLETLGYWYIMPKYGVNEWGFVHLTSDNC
jgi:hypothetical protein